MYSKTILPTQDLISTYWSHNGVLILIASYLVKGLLLYFR